MSAVIPFISRLTAEQHERWLNSLRRRLPQHRVVSFEDLSAAEKQACQVAIVANPDPHELQQLTGLIWVHSVWAGVEKMMAELPPELAVVRLQDPRLAQTMAEAVLAWTLYLHRDMPAYRRQQQDHEWRQLDYTPAANRQIGILGLGNLGQAAAKILVRHGFPVTGWSRHSKHLDGVESVTGETGLAKLLRQADILINLLPLTPSSRGLLNQQTLAKMKTTAALVNFGRAGTLDTDSLLQALDQKQLSHAVLDVFDEEPLPAHSPLWSHERVTVLPHISAPTDIASATEIVGSNLERYFRDGTMPETVDPAQGY